MISILQVQHFILLSSFSFYLLRITARCKVQQILLFVFFQELDICCVLIKLESLAVHSLFGLVITHKNSKLNGKSAWTTDNQYYVDSSVDFLAFLVCTIPCCVASGSPVFVICKLEFVKATVPNKVHIDIHSQNVEMGWLKFSDVTPNDQRQSFESKVTADAVS